MLLTRFASSRPIAVRWGEGAHVDSMAPRAAGRVFRRSLPANDGHPGPQEGLNRPVPAQLDQLWEDIRTELRRETPDFKYHIWLEPLELAAVRGQTLYIRAPDHIRTSVAERYLPLLRRMARTCFDDGALVEVVDRSWQPPREESGDFPGSPRHPLTEFNPKYTFEQFVIGESNHLAHAAALAVAELPAQAYNPLFLHGPPGIGKTHLLHAIGDYLQRYAVDLRVRYATIDEFTTDFVRR